MELRVEKQASVSLRVPVDYVSLSTVLQFEFPECTYKLAYRSLMFQINHI